MKACRRNGVCEDKEDGASASAESSAPVSRENVDMLKGTLSLERFVSGKERSTGNQPVFLALLSSLRLFAFFSGLKK